MVIIFLGRVLASTRLKSLKRIFCEKKNLSGKLQKSPWRKFVNSITILEYPRVFSSNLESGGRGQI